MPKPIRPMVIEQSGLLNGPMIFISRLLKDRIIFIGTPIDDNIANVFIAQMLFFADGRKKKDIIFM